MTDSLRPFAVGYDDIKAALESAMRKHMHNSKLIDADTFTKAMVAHIENADAPPDDARKWARDFMDVIRDMDRDDIDEGLMIGWFANAIEESHSHRMSKFPMTMDLESRNAKGEPVVTVSVSNPSLAELEKALLGWLEEVASPRMGKWESEELYRVACQYFNRSYAGETQHSDVRPGRVMYGEPIKETMSDGSIVTEPTHYVLNNGAATFVKDAQFFIDQGGLEKSWGKAWRPVTASCAEEARKIAATMPWPKKYPEQRPESYFGVIKPSLPIAPNGGLEMKADDRLVTEAPHELQWTKLRKIEDLRRGMIVRNAFTGVSYVVEASFGPRATALRSVDVTNPMEWEFMI